MSTSKNTRQRYALALALLLISQFTVIAAVWFIVGSNLNGGTRAALLTALTLILLSAIGAGMKYMFDAYFTPLARLREELAMLASNPSHRIAPFGAREVRGLIEKLNLLAAENQALRLEAQEKIATANRALTEEKNRLATLMAELAVGVVVCNLEGRILLFNKHALQLLGQGRGSASAQGTALIGLGRSLFGLIDRGLVVHALEQIQYRLHRQKEHSHDSMQDAELEREEASSHFVASLPAGQLVRARMAPVLDEAERLNGFLLVLENITHEVEIDSRRDALLLSLTRDARAALANLRAAVETLQTFPTMDSSRRARFIAVIDEESQRLVRQVDRAQQEHGGVVERRREFEDMRVADLLALLRRRIDSPLLHVHVIPVDDAGHAAAESWLTVDAYSLSQALAHWCRKLADQAGVANVELRSARTGGLVRLELSWKGVAPGMDTLHEWEQMPLPTHSEVKGECLAEVLARHGAESVYRYDASFDRSSYWVLLPAGAAPQPLEVLRHIQGRPEFYDFDLFQQAGQNAELDQLSLGDLNYTVFDTETTGLQPTAGDEIISIGAVRIVNGRLLQQEYFDRLIRPRCALSDESIKIHGITDAMLTDQPRAELVLPQFQRFVEDTVLVAHNAAFDLRFLQMQEEPTGVQFRQPVLDTLLLSQVIHPYQAEHTLEAIAGRLGVTIVGRHTALGDAIVTAEVFLRMLPLLADQGIHTLGQARHAERQTKYARLRY
jgi:DNA polymerase-3 subunit epsilon